MEPIVNQSEFVQLKKAGLDDAIKDIGEASHVMNGISKTINDNPNYSDEFKEQQINSAGAEAAEKLSNVLLTKHLNNVNEYEGAKKKVATMLSAKGTTDLILLGQHAALISQEDMSFSDVLGLGSLDSTRAALLNPIARYKLLRDDDDGSREKQFVENVARGTLGADYETFKRQELQINLVRGLIERLSKRGNAMKAAGVPHA